MTDRGVVRDWHEDEGWGVIDSPRTPGGCWVHFADVAVPTADGLRPGQDVAFTFEPAEQDGYHYRATRAWPWGEPPGQHPGVSVFDDRSGAYNSSLTLTYDDPAEAAGAPAAGTTHRPPPPSPVLGTVTVTVHEMDPGRNEVRVDSRGTLSGELVDVAVAELQRVRRQLPG